MSVRRNMVIAVLVLGGVVAVWLLTRGDRSSPEMALRDAGVRQATEPGTGTATGTGTGTGTGSATGTATATAAAAGSAPPRGDGSPSSVLPSTPPSSYQVSEADGRVFINLRGGTSTLFTMPVPGEADRPTRRLRGRVVDKSGAAVTDAVVAAGADLGLHWANLSADDGIAVDRDGGFELTVPRTEIAAIALSPRGWSAIVVVPAGTTASPITILIDAPARVRGTVTRAGVPEQADLMFRLDGVDDPPRLAFETDAFGRFDVQPFAPGRYRVGAGQSQMMGGGNSATVEQTVDVIAGQTAELTIALPTGNLLVVEVVLPDDAAGMVEVLLLAGTVAPDNLDDAKAQVRAGGGDSQLVGGGSVSGHPMEFHDRSPGDYIACASVAVRDPAQTGFRCQPVTLTAAVPVLEVRLEVPLSQAPAEPE